MKASISEGHLELECSEFPRQYAEFTLLNWEILVEISVRFLYLRFTGEGFVDQFVCSHFSAPGCFLIRILQSILQSHIQKHSIMFIYHHLGSWRVVRSFIWVINDFELFICTYNHGECSHCSPRINLDHSSVTAKLVWATTRDSI